MYPKHMEQRLAHSSFSWIFAEGRGYHWRGPGLGADRSTSNSCREVVVPLTIKWGFIKRITLLMNYHRWGRWRGRWGLVKRTKHSLAPAHTVLQDGTLFTYMGNSQGSPWSIILRILLKKMVGDLGQIILQNIQTDPFRENSQSPIPVGPSVLIL